MAAMADKDEKNETPEELRAENEQLREQLRIKDEYIKLLEQKLAGALETNSVPQQPAQSTSSSMN